MMINNGDNYYYYSCIMQKKNATGEKKIEYSIGIDFD